MRALISIASVIGIAGASLACGGSSDGGAVTPPAGQFPGPLTVASGLQIKYFAKVPGARVMAVGPDGAVYVSVPGGNKIVRVWDANGDKVADSSRTAVGGLHGPSGLAFHKGYLYIANTNGVVRTQLDSQGSATGPMVSVNSLPGGGGHSTRTIVFGADSAMYVTVGSSCNLCVESDSERATTMRFDEDGSNGRVFARGLRNAVGLAVNPTTHKLWVSQNERDNITPDHQNLPPEEINILQDGKDYGWPYCYSLHGAAVPNPEYNDAGRCATTVPAALEMQAHSAPLGMTFLDKATLLSADYRSDLLLAFHGSWDRDQPTGAKVVRVRVSAGVPTEIEDFVVGWQRADGTRWGRPADVQVYTDGSVLISDDQSGSIYRVAP
ncbi:MAG: PQQ-dependent sugar dehydrogenase [Gemmatimonadaceae bacterium]|nr:PQQ-dependent sugar dehydrogenase [Gemmatimonadaceae bacterium]